MIKEISRLLSELFAEIGKIAKIDSPLERAALAGKETYDKIREMLAFISAYSFATSEEEIDFYKEGLPTIFAEYYYWSKVLDLEVKKKGISPDMIRSVITGERSDIQRFYISNRSFLKYYFKNLNFFDIQIFKKEGREFWPFDDFEPQFDDRIPKATEVIGFHLAYEKYSMFLSLEEELLIHGNLADSVLPNIELLVSDADLVELISPVHELKLLQINGKIPSQAELLEIVDKYLHRKIKDSFSTIDNKNRSRKKGATPFLQRLLDTASQRNDRLEK
jgi:hypothetical protein